MIFSRLMSPVQHFSLFLSGEETSHGVIWSWVSWLISYIFGAFWVLPVFLLSRLVSALWYQVSMASVS